MAILYNNHEVKIKLNNKRKLSSFIQNQVLQECLKKINLAYIFCTDEYLLHMNVQFLNHDTYTDIITFDLSENEKCIDGEIYISTDRIQDNAKQFNVDFDTELHRVIFHGALHLCGYKDKTKADKQCMTTKENEWLEAYFVQ